MQVWIEDFTEYLPEYYASLQTPQLVNVCKRAAIARLGKELFDTYLKLFGYQNRTNKLYTKFEGMQLYAGQKKLVNTSQTNKINYMHSSVISYFFDHDF